MPFKIGIKTNGPEITAMLKKATRDNPRAAARALNRTANTVRSHAVKSITADIGIKQKVVRQGLFKILRATFSRLRAAIPAKGKRIPAIELKPQPKRVIRPQPGEGVSFLFRGRRVLARGSFIGRMRGQLAVLRRASSDRRDLRYVGGPSIGSVLLSRKIQRVLRAVFSDRFPKEFSQALRSLRRR